MRKPTLSSRQLMDRIAMSIESTKKYPPTDQAQAFIAHLCGALESNWPEIAVGLAEGAGMPYLYKKSERS